MQFIKIRGKDIQDCFMQMKMKFGPEAHVYEHRVITEGGMFGSGFMAKKFYEIDVAIPEQQATKDRVERKIQDLKELLREKTSDASKKKTLKDMEGLVSKEKPVLPPELIKMPSLPPQVSVSSLREERKDLGLSLRDEIAKKEVPAKPNFAADSSNLVRFREKLIQEGMSTAYATEFTERLDLHLSLVERSKNSAVIEKAKELLIERISVDPDLFSGAGRGKRKIVFFVGPTGSGKTTTIAKLAAKYYLHMGRAVSLYTTDNYRIAAIEQLKRYADTMDIPFYAVKEIKKFREALLRDGSELILIDTAGYSHRNAEFYSKMKAYEEAFSEKDEVENILVISGTSSYSNTKSVMNAYEETGYKRVILTKLDETDYVGSFLELADKYSKTFAYFSTGQEVPFDIASTDKKLFAEIVINPEKIKEIKGESFASVN